MKKHLVFLFFLISISYQGIAFSLSSFDSVGVSKKEGIKYILHEVDAGETLYALSRRYNVDVQSIKDANGSSINNLSIGQRVFIPFPEAIDATGGLVHIVKSSETLFSISRLYNVKVDDLKKWNSLAENSISIGQRLVIRSNTPVNEQSTESTQKNRKTHTVEQSQTLYSISRMYDVSTDQLIEWNNLESNALNVGQVLIVSSSATTSGNELSTNSSMLPSDQNKAESLSSDESIKEVEVKKETTEATVITSTSVLNESEVNEGEKPAEKVIQKGMAEVIEDTAETKKYLALHREAPVGTIMQVKNEMNKQSVFVRIVGPIPPTGDNSKVILKLSQKAYDRLGAVDSRFPVELSYIP